MASGGLFRKFSLDDVSTQNNVKSSVQRAIRGEIGRERGGRGGERGEGEAAREGRERRRERNGRSPSCSRVQASQR
jgi:hypothetical protein